MLTALRQARRALPLGRRTNATELLDGGGLSRSEVAGNLADLARLNRLPGGVGASIAGVRQLVGETHDAARILDAGAGGADMALAFARLGWVTTAIDTQPDVVWIARRATDHEPRITVIEADVRQLPFDDATFDVAHASLVAHHLEPDELVAALRGLRRVARRGVVINDLRRGLLPLAATVGGVLALARSPVTRADALASVRRAYTLAELDRLLTDAGLEVRWRSSPWMPRVVTAAISAA